MHTLIQDTNRLAGPEGKSRLSNIINTNFILYADDTAVIGDPQSVTVNTHALKDKPPPKIM